MAIEKILIRLLIGLSAVFLIITMIFYPPSYAVPPLLFLVVFIFANFLLPSKLQAEDEKKKITSKILHVGITLGILGCIVGLFALWKFGHFGRLN